MRDEALASARAADREIRAGRYRGPLHGVPVAVKDLCYTKGVRTMGGTKVREDFVPDVDATVVSRLRDAGAVLLGKLNLSEGATAGYHPDRDVPVNPGIRIDGPACHRAGRVSPRLQACATPPSVRTQEDRFETRRLRTARLDSNLAAAPRRRGIRLHRRIGGHHRFAQPLCAQSARYRVADGAEPVQICGGWCKTGRRVVSYPQEPVPWINQGAVMTAQV